MDSSLPGAGFLRVVIHIQCFGAFRFERAPIDINPRPKTFGTTRSLTQVSETETQRADDFIGFSIVTVINFQNEAVS
jgi:hypothetical protein